MIPKGLPTIKQLIPYFIVALLTGISAMWLRLGDRDVSCDARVAKLEEIHQIEKREWQEERNRQEARIDTAYALIQRVQKEASDRYRGYFEAFQKIKK